MLASLDTAACPVLTLFVSEREGERRERKRESERERETLSLPLLGWRLERGNFRPWSGLPMKERERERERERGGREGERETLALAFFR